MDTAKNSIASRMAFIREHVIGSTVTIKNSGVTGIARWAGVGRRNEIRIGIAVEGRNGLVFADTNDCRR